VNPTVLSPPCQILKMLLLLLSFPPRSYPWISMAQPKRALKKTRYVYEIKCFNRISFCFSPILNTVFSYPKEKEFFHPNGGSLSTASAHSVRLFTTSVGKDGVFAGDFLKQQINTFAAVVSTEILPMILNDTAGKINKNDVHVRDMFCSNCIFKPHTTYVVYCLYCRAKYCLSFISTEILSCK
jgi:hypothetical protein